MASELYVALFNIWLGVIHPYSGIDFTQIRNTVLLLMVLRRQVILALDTSLDECNQPTNKTNGLSKRHLQSNTILAILKFCYMYSLSCCSSFTLANESGDSNSFLSMILI